MRATEETYRERGRRSRLMTRSRVSIAAASLLLLSVYVFPLWHISLNAPQYPEGLGLFIEIDNVRGASEGNLASINGLNHYIGMKEIHADSIPELKIMPWLVGILIALGLAAAASGKRWALYSWTGLFFLVAVAGLVDFYLWEYDYGHNLDHERAIIKVPGMSYQPPLIGSRKMLNITAVSLPALGGILVCVSLLTAMAVSIYEMRLRRHITQFGLTFGLAAMIGFTAGCSSGPRPISYDEDLCLHCRMTLTDARFGTQIVTQKGKVLTFDSIECLRAHLATSEQAPASVWVTDLANPGTLIPAETAFFARSEAIRSPMGGDLGAYASAAARDEFLKNEGGAALSWGEVLPQALIRVSPTGSVTSVGDAVLLANEGDRIVVEAGTYLESGITIDRPMTLVGVGRPILQARNGEQILVIRADGVTVEGFTFRGIATSFVEDRAAIRVENASACRIADNTFDDAFFGVYLAKVRDCTVANNTLVSDKLGETRSGNGIHLWHSKNVEIYGNLISGHRDGIYLEFSSGITVSNNEATRNRRYGLHFMFSDNCRYFQNAFVNNDAGVAVMYSKHVEMEGNRFVDNWGPTAFGLLLKDITDSRLHGNLFDRNTVGIYAEGANRLQIEQNEFVANGRAIKLMANSIESIIRGNNFLSNTFDVTTNSRQSYSTFEQNYWDSYRGYDLDRDGTGDVPFYPVRLFALIVEQNEPTVILMRSLFVDLLDAAERVLPTLTPKAMVDERPLMKPAATIGHHLEKRVAL